MERYYIAYLPDRRTQPQFSYALSWSWKDVLSSPLLRCRLVLCSIALVQPAGWKRVSTFIK